MADVLDLNIENNEDFEMDDDGDRKYILHEKPLSHTHYPLQHSELSTVY